jgi:hypothetical protein
MSNSRDASPTPPFAYKYCSQHQHEGEKFLNEGRILKERNRERGEKKGKKNKDNRKERKRNRERREEDEEA